MAALVPAHGPKFGHVGMFRKMIPLSRRERVGVRGRFKVLSILAPSLAANGAPSHGFLHAIDPFSVQSLTPGP
jgi:hypothetical protein